MNITKIENIWTGLWYWSFKNVEKILGCRENSKPVSKSWVAPEVENQGCRKKQFSVSHSCFDPWNETFGLLEEYWARTFCSLHFSLVFIQKYDKRLMSQGLYFFLNMINMINLYSTLFGSLVQFNYLPNGCSQWSCLINVISPLRHALFLLGQKIYSSKCQSVNKKEYTGRTRVGESVLVERNSS